MLRSTTFLRQDFKDFTNFVKTLSGFVFDQADYNLDFDCIFDLKSQKIISDFILNYNKDLLSDDYLNTKFNTIQNQILLLVEEFNKQKSSGSIEKYVIYRQISTLHNFLQATLENSIISEQVMDTLKDDYQEQFLQTLQNLDAQIQSQTTPNLSTIKTQQIGITHNARLYLCLKKWKDILHKHYNSEILPINKFATAEIKEFFSEKLPNFVGSTQELFALYTFGQYDIIALQHIAKFVHIKYYNFLASLYGGKNLGLAVLYNNGILIPETFCLSVISAQKNEINLEGLDTSQKYAIRSSATVEDSQNQSFAGMFDSVLNVDFKNINKAIRYVVDSVNSPRVQEYVKHFKTDTPQMAVVVQAFKPAQFAGVWLGNNINAGYLEWTEGVGDKLVSGKVIPHSEIWGRELLQNCLCVGGKPVAQECIKIQRLINSECDLEFCIVDNQLFFLQCRPITKNIKNVDNYAPKDNINCIFGTPASSGIATGKPVYIKSPDESFVQDGQILLVDFTEPEWFPLILKARAIVSAEGGMLSHTAIIAREIGLPCVVGIGYENMQKIKNAKSITVDGNQGSIKIN